MISLSSLCKIIWRHWNYKMPVRYILSSVWVRSSILSQLSIMLSIIQYVGLCVFSLPTPLGMIERIYIFCLIIITKSEVWTVTHCLGLGHETMVCAVCLSIFLYSSKVFYIKLIINSWTLVESFVAFLSNRAAPSQCQTWKQTENSALYTMLSIIVESPENVTIFGCQL